MSSSETPAPAAIVILNNGNTYTGITTIRGGVSPLPLIANGNITSPLGASSNAAANLVLDGGTIEYAGASGGSTDRLFTLTSNGGTIDSFRRRQPGFLECRKSRDFRNRQSHADINRVRSGERFTPSIVDPSTGSTR